MLPSPSETDRPPQRRQQSRSDGLLGKFDWSKMISSPSQTNKDNDEKGASASGDGGEGSNCACSSIKLPDAEPPFFPV